MSRMQARVRRVRRRTAKVLQSLADATAPPLSLIHI